MRDIKAHSRSSIFDRISCVFVEEYSQMTVHIEIYVEIFFVINFVVKLISSFDIQPYCHQGRQKSFDFSQFTTRVALRNCPCNSST